MGYRRDIEIPGGGTSSLLLRGNQPAPPPAGSELEKAGTSSRRPFSFSGFVWWEQRGWNGLCLPKSLELSFDCP